jgi:hypothetical protein
VELDADFKPDWPIRQGDLLGFWDWSRQQPLHRFGVIITADCDIENGHPDQELVYLRTVTQAHYVDIFWSRSKLAKACDHTFQDLVPQINSFRRQNDPNAEDLHRAEIEPWIATSRAQDIAEEIGVNEEQGRQKLVRNVARAQNVLTLTTVAPTSACLDRLIKLTNKDRNQILRQAVNDLQSARDEIFFLTAFTSVDDDAGYYVLLDQIGATRRDQISDSFADVKNGRKAAYRFGSLAKTYKYALAQRFAFLFQRIGLPDDHIERHRNSLTRITSPKGDSTQGNS